MTIAGSDSSAGAGIQADLKTFAAHKVYGVCVITAITSQTTTKISDIFKIPIEIIENQLDTLLEDVSVDAIKTGMLVSSQIIELVVNKINAVNVPIVVDPIIKAGTGRSLLEKSAMDTLESLLFPIAEIITPNIFEAESFSGITIKSEAEVMKAAEKLIKKGAQAVLIKGGDLDSKDIMDFLLLRDGTNQIFTKTRVSNQERHGSGCVLSAAITANLANNYDLLESVERAEKYVEKIYPDVLEVGRGTPPMNPFYGLF
ncbi:MAG: bifunctional hydroxymethylpyrimidine kinase/phosphomethylpyrimidine kinase [Candidatus Helarchaeota archaeon]|nr:bifunctional hydroxymethylpyrimidine kinase/phosphomethylpyrimidine kinase [Candidatus Helarchaeota archaeon]